MKVVVMNILLHRVIIKFFFFFAAPMNCTFKTRPFEVLRLLRRPTKRRGRY